MVLYDNRPLADNLTATDTWSVNRKIKEMLFLLGWILMNSGYCMISGICSKHNSYSSSETKSFLCRSVCLIRSFQNRISVSAESREENSGNFSIMESIISCLICPIDTYLISSWNKSVFSLETFFIPVHLLLFVIYILMYSNRIGNFDFMTGIKRTHIHWNVLDRHSNKTVEGAKDLFLDPYVQPSFERSIPQE